jgi:hypothetical protein
MLTKTARAPDGRRAGESAGKNGTRNKFEQRNSQRHDEFYAEPILVVRQRADICI